MEESNNLTQDDVLELILNFPVQPIRNKLIITINTEEMDGNLVLSNNAFSEVQYVIARGEFVAKEIQAGQKVILDLEKMTEFVPSETDTYEKVGKIKIKPIEVDGVMYALISDSFIDAIDKRN